MLSFGDFQPFLSQIRRTPAKVVLQVQTLAQAKEALSAGADAVIAQGTEAGGHGGARSTFPFVPAVVDIAQGVPVIAAGGIADGRGLVAALALGAAGVLCGTAFVATDESLADATVKRAVMAGQGDNTECSVVFDLARNLQWPPQWNLRALANPFTKQLGSDVAGLVRYLESERARFKVAVAMSDLEIAAVIVGEAVDLVRTGGPAGDVIQTMIRAAESQVRRVYSGVMDS